MSTKKIVSAMLMIFMVSVLGFAAGEGEGEAGSGGGSTELTFWTFNELHQQYFEAAAARWNEQNPDNQIELMAENFPYEDMHSKLLVSLQSGSGAPDICDVELSKFPNYLKGNIQLLPMNDQIDPIKDQFISSRFEIYSKDGNYYGVPFHVGAAVIYYNVEILNAAGVNPDDIVTWEDFVKAGIKVKEATGKYMTTLETVEHWSYYPLISQQDSDFFKADGTPDLANKTNVDTLQFLSDLMHKYEIAEGAPGGFHHSEEYWGAMNNGDYASVWMPMWYMGRFTDYMPDLAGKIAIRPLPAWTEGGKRSAGMGGTGTVVTNQSKSPDLAKEFLAFAKLSEEGNIQLWEFLGFDPPRWSVWDDDALKQENKFTKYFVNDDIFGILLDVKDEINPLVIPETFPECISLVQRDVMPQVLVDQTKTPEEALQDVTDKLK